MSFSSSPTLHTVQLGKSWFAPGSGGGLDRMFDGLLRHLPAAGVPSQGFVAGPRPAADVPAAIQGVGDETASLVQRARGFRSAVRRALASSPADLVAAHFALYAAPVLDLLDGRPLVCHFHGPWGLESAAEGDPEWKVRLKTAVEALVYRRAAHFIVLSDAFRDILETTYGVPRRRISIVPGGVDLPRFDVEAPPSAARRRLSLPTDRPIALSVRRLARRMGLETLIDAWTDVVARHPEALLLIAGTGPLRDDLQAQIERLGLTQHVRLLGFVPDPSLPYLYRAADVSVLPTVALEGFGLTTIESLAAGTPALVTPVGGLPEVVRGLSDALLLPDASAPALAHGIATAFSAPDRLPSAAACRAFVEAHYAWPAIAARTARVYEQVAAPAVAAGA